MLIEKPTGEIRIAYDHDNEPYLFEATGKEAKHFCDILRAEDDGRLVTLPCKVGDMVYYRRGRDILGDTVERIIIDGIDNQVIVGAHKVFMFWDFGRNVFTSREEAEAAFKEGRDDGTA